MSQSPKRRSIGDRLSRAGSADTRREIALDWADSWRADHDDTLRAIEKHLERGDVDAAGQHLGRLKALNEKAHDALPRVLAALARDDD
ncbi:hypothetical protein GCM10019059_07930 [Camelimonas fluminis]|uniref:Uncharacterized protein n=1 Tax=Camelimonas fluminis TaxID=1576911 RepID=A0ABV7UFS7_9HYPH|nr:hypothetical protein [Camelimonas fluminis]GHE51123.1 hypothetical protein GCM10019059_07930 [Camelimonas fluminis]